MPVVEEGPPVLEFPPPIPKFGEETVFFLVPSNVVLVRGHDPILHDSSFGNKCTQLKLLPFQTS